MRFVVITYAPLTLQNGQYWGYMPYIREMNLWLRHVDEAIFICPLAPASSGDLLAPLESPVPVKIIPIPAFNFTSIGQVCKAVIAIPKCIYQIAKGFVKADHVHLRVPGNVGLLACMVQIFFPGKNKTAKYAGNWDSRSQQPISYRWQKGILNNSFLTRKMAVLVYGEWPGDSKNVVPFFTASYYRSEYQPVIYHDLRGKLRLVFAGTLVDGKRPLAACETLRQLRDAGIDARLDMLGDGNLRGQIEKYIEKYKLTDHISLHGNVSAREVAVFFRHAHFLVFLSKSEGWPKAVAESMFWGSVPVATAVSCIPSMLGQGLRGSLVDPYPEAAVKAICQWMSDEDAYQRAQKAAAEWSRQFTLDSFEEEIARLLRHDFDLPFVTAVHLT